MQYWYANTLADRGDMIKSIAIYFNDQNKPIAVCAILKNKTYYGCNCGTFVLDNYRRCGIGRKLINVFKKKNINIHPWKGCPQARDFYNKTV